jgi:DNA-binding XRE family transcriptional regulator
LINTWREVINMRRLLFGTPVTAGCTAPDGWRQLVEDTDLMLASVDPNYRFTEVQAVQGVLVFRFRTELVGLQEHVMHAIVVYTKALSATVCEICGLSGQLRGQRAVIRTLCDGCASNHVNGVDDIRVHPVELTVVPPPEVMSELEVFLALPIIRSLDPAEAAQLLRDRLRYLRSLQRLTPAESAARAGITIDAMAAIESGTRPPTAVEVLGLSWAFGVPYEKVFPGFGIEA